MIRGISEKRRLPRAGKIHLGVKVAGKNPCKSCQGKGKRDGQECGRCKGTGRSMYPTEVDYFVCPPEILKVYGEKPRALDIMIPVEDSELFFPQALKRYGAGKGLKCRGDGDRAWEVDEKTGEFVEIECGYKDCPHYKNDECREVGNLMALLPKVGIMNGIYQIDTGSYHSIVQVNSDVDFVRSLVASRTGQLRISMIPLKLFREPKETHGSGRKEVHYCLRLKIEDGVLNALKPMALPAPPKYRLVTAGRNDIEEDLYPRTIVESIKRAPEKDNGEDEKGKEGKPPRATRKSYRELRGQFADANGRPPENPEYEGQDSAPSRAAPPAPAPSLQPHEEQIAGEDPAPPLSEEPESKPPDQESHAGPEGMDDFYWEKIEEGFEIARVNDKAREQFRAYYKDHPDLLLQFLDSWIAWRDNGRQGPPPKPPQIPAAQETRTTPAPKPTAAVKTAAPATNGATKRSLF